MSSEIKEKTVGYKLIHTLYTMFRHFSVFGSTSCT